MAEMKLIGSRITKITAQRNPNFEGELQIKTNIKIPSIEKAKEQKDTVKISYEFEIDYGNLGKVEISGILFIAADSKLTKDLIKFHTEQKFETPEQLAITNLILQKASVKAFELEEELGLPIHIRLPTLSTKKE
jgi:hypothetical protein